MENDGRRDDGNDRVEVNIYARFDRAENSHRIVPCDKAECGRPQSQKQHMEHVWEVGKTGQIPVKAEERERWNH